MIKTKALEKTAAYLRKKGIVELNFALKDGQGFLTGYRRGARYVARICHDTSSVKVEVYKTEWL